MKEELLQTDRQFSMMSASDGVKAAFGQFMADSAIMYREGQNPFIGRDAITDLLGGYPANAELTWEPWKAEVAESGDLGYTLGQYTYSIPDELTDDRKYFYGNYVSIWRKIDGEWKWVFDHGASAPAKN